MNIRALAATTLSQLLQHKGSLKSVMPQALAKCPERDRALFQQICFGTMRMQPRLQLIANHLLKRKFKHQDHDLFVLLMIGLYQLLEMRIPSHAAINETVEATAALDKEWRKGLFNGVLRHFQREQEDILAELEAEPVFQYNHPDWLIMKLQHNWPDHWQQILQQNDQHPPMTLRINKQKITRDAYLLELEEHGISARPGQYSDTAVYLELACDVKQLPGFAEGVVSVQDEAAQLSAELLAPKAGDRVLDACAAPGGKLCHLIEQQPELAAIDAVELERKRAPRIQENLDRQGLSANLLIGDAATKEWWDGQPYQRILVDAPCSATGVIRRNPDIKFLRKGEEIVPITDIQLNILTNCWDMLAEGGRLLYATCSIFPQENERLIARFLKQHPEATEIELNADWGISRPHGRQLFPEAEGHDGFYYALLEKQTG